MVHELHDLVAHAVAQVIVQAGVLEARAAAPEPCDAEALAAIRSAATSAMRDLRRIHDLLDGGDPPPYGPQPGIGALADLLDDVRRSGMAPEVAVATAGLEVPPALGLAAYRLTQRVLEGVRALEGARLHRLTIAADGEDLALRATIELPAGAREADLATVLEPARHRAALHGGSLAIGRRGDGLRSLAARLPLAD